MVKLADGDRKKLIKLLKKLPELEDERSRQAFLEYAGLGDLIPRINLSGKQFVAVGEIVKSLSQYERLPNGCEALGIFLDSLNDPDFVGKEHQEFLESLLKQYNMMAVSPPSEMRSDWGESKEERFDFLDWDEGVASRISARVNRRPFVLPQADVSTFTGREEELEKLKALAIDSQGEKQCSIVSVAGTGGIGKSALACRFAKQYRDHFPDGVIGLRVDGKDTETIAREFAREMGVVLEDEEEQGLDAGTIMRELFASRKMLLIFDNADEASIKKLRPGGNICAIIITTRDRNLSFALDIPHEGTIDLPLLPKPESLLLLQRILGEERVNNELDAAYEIIRLVGNLPLALQISGANLKGKTRHLSDYAAYLRKKRADLKVRGNKDLNLQASLAISLESLEKDELDFFACLSVCAEDGFSRKTATIAGDCEDEWEAQDYLDSLYQLSLINEMETGENRFAFHPLIREFALKLAKSGSVYKKAAQRHAEYFINWIQSNSENLRIVASQIAEDIDDLILVGEWLRNTKIVNYDFIESLHEFFEEYGYWKKAAELMRNFQEFAKQSKDWEFVVVFCTRQAKYLSLQEKFEEAKGICKVIPEILENIESETVRKRSHVKFLIRLGRILEYQEDFHEAIEQLQLAVSIARDMDEPDSLRNALRVLGWVAKKQGEVDKAIESFQEEIQLNEILNHQQGIAITLNCIGGLLQQQERFDEALSTFQRSIEVSEAINDQREIAIALNCIGGLLQKQEKYDEALSAFERQIEVSEAINDQKQILIALNCMGGLLQQQGKYDEALSAFKREIEVDEAINNQQGIAIALNRMGGLLQQQGKYDEALSAFKREIEIDEAINNQQRLAIVLNRMGGLLQEQGRYDEAISAFERQIEVSEAINDQQGIAIALNRMGGLLQEQGRYDEAISAFERQIEVNKNLNNQQGIAIAFHRIGMLLNRQNRIDEAIDVFERQIKITKSISNSNFFKKNGSEVLIVHFNCLRIVRQLFQQYKKFKKAREIIVIQIEISEIIDNKKNLAIALNYMGKLLQEQGKYDEAISAFERQIKVSEAISDQKSIAIALTCIGGLLQRQGRYDEAIAIFEREIEIDEVLNDYRGVTIALQQIGKILEKQSQFDKAEQVFRRNYDLAFQLEDRQGQAIILKNLGRVLYKQGGKENLDFARIQLKESIRLCQELEDLENLAKVRIVMGEALLAYQKDEQAAIELIKGFEIEETLMNSKGVDIAIQPLIYVLVKLNREKETKQYFKRALAIAPDNQNILELQKQLLSGVLLKQGKVIKIKYNKNEQMYGWIMPSDRSDNIYFHEPFVNSDCVSQLKKGVQVEVFIKKAEKGYCATYIRILDDGIETPSA